MASAPRRPLRVVEATLAALVCTVVALELTALPEPYPTWPTLLGVAVNPELVVPGLLGLVALVGAVRDGPSVGSVVVGGLGLLTLWLAATSVYALTTGTAGGVFWGGFFTVVAAVALVVAVGVRDVVEIARDGTTWRR